MRLVVKTMLAATLICLSCSSEREPRLVWWHFWTSPEVKPVVEEMTAGFQSENPDVTVQLGDLTWSDGHQKIVIALATGGGPDVIELGSDWVAEFAAAGRLLDITDDLGGLTDSLQAWEPVLHRGRCFGVPWMLGTRVLFCNRSLLGRAGYEPDFVPQSWEELLQASRGVHNPGEDVFGFASNSAERHRLYKKYLPFFWSAGGEVFSADGWSTNFSSPEGIRSLTFYLELTAAGLIESQARLEEYFAAGKIGFIISGEWLVKRLAGMPEPIDYFVTLIPGIDADKPGISFAGGEYLVINSQSRRPREALRLIRHLTLPENDRQFTLATGSFTPVNHHTNIDFPDLLRETAQVFQTQLAHSRSTPAHPAWVAIEEILESGLEQAIYGKLTAAEALSMIDRECNLVLAKYARP